MSPMLQWDQVGERLYETGVDRGVLYLPSLTTGLYDTAAPWNGVVSVTESPSGAEPTPQYADNIKYINLMSTEEFSATLEAFTYPDEFAECDGSALLTTGVRIGQQSRRTFGLSYRTKIGNDLVGNQFAHKYHLVYGALAAPTEKAYTTINDSPEATPFSWELSTTPVEVPGFAPTALLTVNSNEISAPALAKLEEILYGTTATPARLPKPAELASLLEEATGVVNEG